MQLRILAVLGDHHHRHCRLRQVTSRDFRSGFHSCKQDLCRVLIVDSLMMRCLMVIIEVHVQTPALLMAGDFHAASMPEAVYNLIFMLFTIGAPPCGCAC